MSRKGNYKQERKQGAGEEPRSERLNSEQERKLGKKKEMN